MDWCEIRYIFPLGNIYIHTHIIRGSVNYSDNRGGGPTGHPVRDRDAVVGIDPDMGQLHYRSERPNYILRDYFKIYNSERIYPRYNYTCTF